MNKHKQYLIDVYIDWSNHYYTINFMAEKYGISAAVLQAMIHEGRRLYNINLEENESKHTTTESHS